AIAPRRRFRQLWGSKAQQDGARLVQKIEHPHGLAVDDEIEVRHTAAEQRVALPKVVADGEAGHRAGHGLAGLVELEEVRDGFGEGPRALVWTAHGDLGES